MARGRGGGWGEEGGGGCQEGAGAGGGGGGGGCDLVIKYRAKLNFAMSTAHPCTELNGMHRNGVISCRGRIVTGPYCDWAVL